MIEVKHRVAFCAGFIATMLGLFVPYLVVLRHCNPAEWYGFRCTLTCAAYMLAIVAGGLFAACVSAYRDRVAEVTGYCHPVREKVR